jgi:hypothetical protein
LWNRIWALARIWWLVRTSAARWTSGAAWTISLDKQRRRDVRMIFTTVAVTLALTFVILIAAAA